MRSGGLPLRRLHFPAGKNIKSRKNLHMILVGICFIVTIVCCCEFFLMQHQSPIFKISKSLEQLHVGKNVFHAVQTWMKNTHSRTNGISLSILEENSYGGLKIHSNVSVLFNSTDMFHRFFRLWFDSRLTQSPLQISFTLNNKHACTNRGRNLSIIIAVTSSASHLQSRSAIRDTWGSLAKARGAKVLFFLGLPKKVKYHSQIIEENTKFKDIIQSSFLDTYANLTIKTISMLKWVSEVCSFVKYVLKVDDDMFINVEKFINIAETKNYTMSILGELAHDFTPIRSLKNKWYASYEDYPFNIYPDFVFGPSYLLTGDTINLLYETSIKISLFQLEDVYITGFVAEKENIQRVNLPAMFNKAKDLQPCSFKRLLSSHGHTPADIRRHWMWLNRRNFQCLKVHNANISTLIRHQFQNFSQRIK